MGARGMAKRVAVTGPVEGPWALPDGWHWRPLGDLGEFLNGAAFKPSDWDDDGTPIIRIQNLNNPDRAMNRTKRTVNARLMVRDGDLLVSWSATLDAFLWRREDAWLNQHIFKVVPDEALVDRRYMFFLLKNEIENLKKTEHLHGSTMMHINRGPFLAHLVPVPPIETQIRVAARIDELFAEIDDGEAALARARDDLATWRKALLKAAVTGELTTEWRAANPSTETGNDLLADVLTDRMKAAAERLGKRRDKVPEEITPAQRDLMWPAPHGWTWMQLGSFSFVTKLAGFEYTKYVRYDDGGDLRVIKAENAGVHGFKKTDYSRVQSKTVSELTRSRLHGGELLMVFVGAGIGNVAMVPDGEEFFLGPNIGMMRVETELVLPRYVELFLRSPIGKALATSAMKAVAQPSLSMGTIRQVPILLPPLAEQNEIISRLERALATTEECDLEVREHQVSAATLRQSILAAAFRGELA